MLFHNRKLIWRESARLFKDKIGNCYLADIMQHSCKPELIAISLNFSLRQPF